MRIPLKTLFIQCRKKIRPLIGIIIAFFVFGLPGTLYSQIFSQVVHTTGTQMVANKSVTVTPVGIPSIFNNLCGAGPYWIGRTTTDGFLFQFSGPVGAVKLEMTASDYDEVMWFIINGNPYTISTANLSAFPGTCSCPFAPVVSNGNLTFTGTTGNAGTTVNISSTISSLQIMNNGARNGTVFNLWIANDAIIQIQPFNDTVLCAHDTLKLPYTTIGQFAPTNVHTVQLSNAVGSFASPIVIGTQSGNTATGTINCVIPPGIVPGTGYRVRVASSNPTNISAVNTVNLKIGDYVPKPLASGSVSICEQDTLFLTSSGAATTNTFQWAGPNSFTATRKDTFITHTSLASSGDYIVTAQSLHCESKDTLYVVVKPIPAKPTTSSNSPLCTGDNLNLKAISSTIGVAYSWEGPGGFTSNSAAPVRTNTEPLWSGEYIGTVSLPNGCSTRDTATVIIHPIPDTPIASSNSPVCVGGEIQLTSSVVAGAVYEWSGPGLYHSTQQNAKRQNVQLTDAGTYTVIAKVNNCPSAPANTTVVANLGPEVLTYANPNDTLCPGWEVIFVASPKNAGSMPSYEWYKNGTPTGGTAITYKATGVSDGDSFYVLMTAGSACNTPISSKPIRITKLPAHTPPTISIASNLGAHVWPYVEVIFKASTGNSGAHPGYQWTRNGKDISKANDSTWGATDLKTGDTICCRVTSNFLCAVPREVMSNCIVMNVDLGIEEQGLTNKLRLYPNPNDGSFTLETSEPGILFISNLHGQTIGEYKVQKGKNSIQLPQGIADGIYMGRLGDNAIRINVMR